MSQWLKDDIMKFAQQEIHNRGFMSAPQLATELTSHFCQMLKDDGENVSDTIVEIIGRITAEDKDIKSVEYTNETVKTYRVKDLFYYMPDKL
jgi:hypothetical protein